MLCSVFCFQSFVYQLSWLSDTCVSLSTRIQVRTPAHTHTYTLIQTAMTVPEEKIATLEFLEENNSEWSQYMSYFTVRQKGMWAGGICSERMEGAVCRWGDKVEVICCSPNYCQVTQAAQMKYILDQG